VLVKRSLIVQQSRPDREQPLPRMAILVAFIFPNFLGLMLCFQLATLFFPLVKNKRLKKIRSLQTSLA